MPPKNKKDAEQQAKRLEQQRKKKEEEEARLEVQRKKYLAESLPTGLLLPASIQLILDFPHKETNFIIQKLKQAIKDAYPAINTSTRLNYIMKQLHYFIKDSYKLFGEAKQGLNVNKHRIFVGILLTILLNNDQQGKGQKGKDEDERKARELVTAHCNKIEGWENFSKSQGLSILKYLKQNYFAKFSLRKMFDKFPKRQSEEKFSIYIETPNCFYNDQSTPFTDLIKKQDEKPKEQPKIS